MKTKLIIAVAAVILSACGPAKVARDSSRDVNIRVEKVWDSGMYCAFTSITKFNGEYYIAFRESDGHIWGDDNIADGTIRILRSADGNKWETATVLSEAMHDLRDPNLSITPDGRLMVGFLRAIYVGKTRTSGRSCVVFSKDGRNFSEINDTVLPQDVATGFDWLWKTVWHDGTGYSVLYSSIVENGAEKNGHTRTALMKTDDGIHYSLVAKLGIPEEKWPNEASVHFLSDGTMCMVMRIETGHALWGTSKYPYTDWEFSDMGMRVGGPDFIVTPDDKIILTTRTYFIPGSYKTVVLKGTPEGKFTEVCFLPSAGHAGDSAYAGLLVVDDELWISYYSSFEAPKPSIYLAKIPMSVFSHYMN